MAAASLSVLAPGLAVLAACESPGQRMAVDVPAGRPPTTSEQVARDVGRLLSGDATASRAAERALLSLDAAGRAALAEHAARIPAERDRRWLNVLDGNGLLPALATADAIDLRLWQAARGEPAAAMRAQAALGALAARDPDTVAGRLRAPTPGRDLLALALGTARARSAVPALVGLYRGPASPEERRAASEALARILGESVRPRVDATDAERESDVAKILLSIAAESKEGNRAGP